MQEEWGCENSAQSEPYPLYHSVLPLALSNCVAGLAMSFTMRDPGIIPTSYSILPPECDNHVLVRRDQGLSCAGHHLSYWIPRPDQSLLPKKRSREDSSVLGHRQGGIMEFAPVAKSPPWRQRTERKGMKIWT